VHITVKAFKLVGHAVLFGFVVTRLLQFHYFERRKYFFSLLKLYIARNTAWGTWCLWQFSPSYCDQSALISVSPWILL